MIRTFQTSDSSKCLGSISHGLLLVDASQHRILGSLPRYLALILSYVIPVIPLLKRKLAGKHPQYRLIKLGREGIPINIFNLIFLLFCTVQAPFPPIGYVPRHCTDYKLRWAYYDCGSDARTFELVHYRQEEVSGPKIALYYRDGGEE